MTEPKISIHVGEDAWENARERAKATLPFETGGIVLGTLTATGVWITVFAEVETNSPHLTRFRIPAGRTHEVVDNARQLDERVGYLGDWHTHPADVGVSNVDLSTLQDLAVGVFRRRRILALLRHVDGDWVLDVWATNRLRRPLRLTYEFVGPLPAPPRAT